MHQRNGKQVITHVLDQTVTFCCTHLKHSGGNTVQLWSVPGDMNHILAQYLPKVYKSSGFRQLNFVCKSCTSKCKRLHTAALFILAMHFEGLPIHQVIFSGFPLLFEQGNCVNNTTMKEMLHPRESKTSAAWPILTFLWICAGSFDNNNQQLYLM